MPRKDESLIEKQRKQLAEIKTNSEQNQEIKRTSTFIEGGMNVSSSKRLKTDFNAVPKEKIKKKQTSKRNLNDIEDYSLKNKFTELKDAEELDMERIDELEQELYGPKVKNFTEEKKELSVEEQEEAHVNELTKLAELNLQCDNFVHKRYRRLPGELYSPKKLYSYCRRWSSVIEIRKTIKKRIDDKISEMQAFAEKHGLDKENIEEDALKKPVKKSLNDKKEERKKEKIPEIKEEEKKEEKKEDKKPELKENKKEENKQEQKDQNVLELEKREQERLRKEKEKEEERQREINARKLQMIEEEQRKQKEEKAKKEKEEKEKKEKEEKEKKEKEKKDKEENDKKEREKEKEEEKKDEEKKDEEEKNEEKKDEEEKNEEKKDEEEKNEEKKDENKEKEDEKNENKEKNKDKEKNKEEKSKEKLAKDYGFEILDLSLDDNMQIIGRRLSANIEKSYKKDKALIELLDEKEKRAQKDKKEEEKNKEKDKPKSVAEELGFELIDEVKEKENLVKELGFEQVDGEKLFNELSLDEQIKVLELRAGAKSGTEKKKIRAFINELKKEIEKNKEAEGKEKKQKDLKDKKDKKQEPKKEDNKKQEVENKEKNKDNKEKEKQQDNKQENKEKKEEYDTKWFNKLTYDEQIKVLELRAGDKTGLDTRKEKDLIKAIKEEIKKEKKKNKEAEKKEKNQKNLKDKKQEPKKENKKNPEVEKDKKDHKNNKKPEAEKNKKPEIQENNKNKEKNKQNQPNPNGEQNKEKKKNDQQNPNGEQDKENNDVEIEFKGLGKFVDVEEMLPPLVKDSLKSQRALKKATEDIKKAREEKRKKSKEDEKNRKEENKKKQKELREQKKKESEEKKKQEKERKDKEKAEKAKAQKKYYIPNTETRISNDIKDYTEEKKKQYVDQLTKKNIKMFANRDEAVKFRTANSHRVKGSKDGYAWNENYDKDIAKAVDWIIEYFMVKDSSWAVLREEKRLKIPKHKYTIPNIDTMKNKYEKQGDNNCYCCSGTASYNQFIRNEIANKRKVTDNKEVDQYALREYLPEFANRDIMKNHIANSVGVDPDSNDAEELTNDNYDKYKNEILEYAGKNKDAVGSVFELADFFLAKQKDIAMHRVLFQIPSAEYKERQNINDVIQLKKYTKDEKKVADHRYNNVKACFLDKVNEVLRTGNTVTIVGNLCGELKHYLTIYGIEGNKLLYMDSLKPNEKNLKADVDEFFLKRDGLGQTIEINWFSKVGDVKQLTGKYRNLNYDKNNGFSLKERTTDEVNNVGHTLGVGASEDVPGVVGVTESIYVPIKFGVPEAQNN